MFRVYIDMLANAFNTDGCTTRADYWSAISMAIFVPLTLMLLSAIFRHSDILLLVILSIVMVILYLVLIAVTIPATIAISARRLHDSGISGWWQLVYFIPGIGPLWLFILLCSSSQLENNPYRQES